MSFGDGIARARMICNNRHRIDKRRSRCERESKKAIINISFNFRVCETVCVCICIFANISFRPRLLGQITFRAFQKTPTTTRTHYLDFISWIMFCCRCCYVLRVLLIFLCCSSFRLEVCWHIVFALGEITSFLSNQVTSFFSPTFFWPVLLRDRFSLLFSCFVHRYNSTEYWAMFTFAFVISCQWWNLFIFVLLTTATFINRTKMKRLHHWQELNVRIALPRS